MFNITDTVINYRNCGVIEMISDKGSPEQEPLVLNILNCDFPQY